MENYNSISGLAIFFQRNFWSWCCGQKLQIVSFTVCGYSLCSVPSSLSRAFSLRSLRPGTLPWPEEFTVGSGRNAKRLYSDVCLHLWRYPASGLLPSIPTLPSALCCLCYSRKVFSHPKPHDKSRNIFSQKETKIHLVRIHFLSRTEITSRHVQLPGPSAWGAETQIQ